VPTDKQFTGQRLDGTGLYYYNARYYDPIIGRFISADTIVPNPANPQAFNRYSYCLNNPLKYIDPSGHGWFDNIIKGLQDALDIAGFIPGIGEVFDLLNAGIYAIRGDNLNAGLSLVGVIPFVGWFSTGSRIGRNVFGIVKNVDKIIEGVRFGSQTGSIIVRASEGYTSFRALKNAIGSPGKGKIWHHIVEQCQAKTTRAGFDAELIHNPNNVIAIDKEINQLIANDYSKTYGFTDGKTLRDWLNTQSYEVQYQYGLDFLKKYGVIQ
jgi:RHS repeat-associated protein